MQKGFFAQLYLIFSLFLLPAIGIYEGLAYFAEITKNARISTAAQDLIKIRNDLKLHADESSFWANRLTGLFAESATPDAFAASLTEFITRYEARVEFATYSPEGKLVADNLPVDSSTHSRWAEAGGTLKTVLDLQQSQERFLAIDSLRPLFGQNFFIPDRGEEDFCVAATLYQSDLEKDHYRYWLAGNRQLMAVVRIPTPDLLKKTGLRHFAATMDHKKISFARFSGSQMANRDFKNTISARVAFNKLRESPGHEFVEIDDKLYSRVKINSETWILIIYELQRDGTRYGHLVSAGLILLICCLVGLRRAGYFPGRVENLSLLVQISVLLAISAGIPLAVLGSVAVNYFSSKKTALMREKNQEMIQFAQQIDRNVQIEYARYTRLIRKSVDALPEALSKNFSQNQLIEIFKKNLGRVMASIQIIKATVNKGNNKQGRPGANTAEYQLLISDMHPNDKEIINFLGKQHLSALNSTPINEEPSDKAFMLELLFQKPVDMIVHDLLLAEGNMTDAGWGMRKVTLFAQAFNVFTQAFFDHFVLVSIVSEALQDNYINRHLHGAIRNPWGFTFYVARDRHFFNEQQALELFPEISRLFMRVSDYPLPEPEIVEYKGEDNLLVVLKGSLNSNLRFCALYPVANISREIIGEAKELLYPAILGGAIVLIMILMLYMNLLLPVNRLHQAARALEKRDASFRLPETKGDEFAEMGAIFNASIAEFEELKIASIVQARLLPGEPLNIKGYSIFGKCLPMVELGGDYFDYFPVDDENFVLLLGDVAGHGVGASLVMAMAKAGVICGSEVYKDPAIMLSRLHQIIFSIKNRVQRKVMTFQYLLVNSTSGRMTYANAGGCSPAFVDKYAGTAVEIRHNGPVLGGFKKTAYSNLDLHIKSGQAIILYTDGMVESRNAGGSELGYQRLFDIFLASFDSDAGVFYQNIMTAYGNWLGQSVVGDDMTLIVMVCV